MYHKFGTLTTSRGDALAGWQVECVLLADGTTVVPIYSDEGSTPIAAVSSVTNRAITDTEGNYDFFVAEGNYTLRYYNAAGVFQRADRYVNMDGRKGDKGDKGDQGDAFGPYFASKAAGETASGVGQGFSYPDGAGGLFYAERTANGAGDAGGNSKVIAQAATKAQVDSKAATADLASTAIGKGAALVGFKQAGAGAVGRTVEEKHRDTLSVFDFIPTNLHAGIALGTTTTDVTSYIVAAMTAAQTISFGEKRLVWPAGLYRVSQIAVRDFSYFTMHAEGTVQIVGIDGSKGFILGDNRFDALGHTENFTTRFSMTGGPWLIAPLAGQNYARGVKLQNFVDCTFDNLLVSGAYTPTGGTGNRIGVELELSFNNAFYGCTFGYAGAPIGSDKSYALWLGGDNCNNNRFYNFRAIGGGSTVANTVGVRVDSVGNAFYGADISSVHTMFELNAAQGCHFINYYGESVSRAVNVVFASRGCFFVPSYLQIAANGTAYDLGGGSDVQTIGFQIIGGEHVFNATGTTFLKKGSNCYGLTFNPGVSLTALPAVYVTGTDRGSGGSTLLDMREFSTGKINFPDTPVPSTNPTTLDCYKELDSSIGLYVGATAQTTGSVTRITKIGRTVTITGYVQMTAAVSGTGNVSIGNLPYVPDGRASASIAMSNVAYTGNISGFVASGGTKIEVLLNGAPLTQAGIDADTLFDFSLTYTATA